MVLCDDCGHLVYESDTMLINELVTCEDCFTVGGAWPQGVSQAKFCFSCGDHIQGERSGLCPNCSDSSSIYHLQMQLAILADSASLHILPFAARLRPWRGRSLEEIGLARVRGTLLEVSEADQSRALIDGTRRVLATESDSEALRYLLVLALAKNPEVPDNVVVDETRVLLRAARTMELSGGWLDLELIKDISGLRNDLAARMVSTTMENADGLPFARRVLSEGESFEKRVRLIALKRIVSSVAEAVSMSTRYYNSLALKVLSDAMYSALATAKGISRFYNLDPSGDQNDKRN